MHSSTGTKFDARGIEGRWVGFDSTSTHAHRIYWPGKNSVSVGRNIKFTPTVLRITFLFPAKGEQDISSTLANQPQFSQQKEELLSVVTDTTKVDSVSHTAAATQSKTPTPTASRPTTRSVSRMANASSTGDGVITHVNTCTDAHRSPNSA